MKTKFHSSFVIRRAVFTIFSTALPAALALFASAPRALAQDDTVTISVAEFQRMVYSAHLHTQLDEKPELDASLQILLELHRRNPHANPAALAAVVQEATARFRASAPSHLRTFGFRDEILAAYLEAFRQVPARTNYVSANLALLNSFMLQPDDYATASAAELIHAGNRRLLTAEKSVEQRQALVEECAQRSGGNPAFGAVLDALLWPEVGVLRAYTAAQILSVNSALNNSPTLQTMLNRSSVSADGSVTLSTNELKGLFALEMETMHEIINTNRAVHLAILETQTDMPSYLTNTALIQANLQWESAIKAGQPQRLAAASAAVTSISSLTASKLPAVGQAMSGLGRGVKSIADGLTGLEKGWSAASKIGKAAASGNLVAGGLAIIGACLDIFGLFQDPNDEILRELNEVKNMISDLSTNMNYRFDQVDQSMDQVLDRLAYSINLIGEVGHNVDEVRRSLVDVQADLHRLERHLLAYVNQLYGRGLNLDFNTYLGYETTYGNPMGQPNYNDTEAHFFTHARNNAADGLSAPYSDRYYTPAALYSELTESGGGTTNRLDQNLSYIKKYLNDVLGQSTAGTLGELANPRDWFVGAYAYAQLAAENPIYFRLVNPTNRLDLITARGRDLSNFFRSLTFTGTNINWPIRNALENYYFGKLTSFTNQVRSVEQQYASDQAFALDTWRQWSAAAPRVNATATEVMVTPAALLPPGQGAISAGWAHFLALGHDGTLVDYGIEADYGRFPIPAGVTNATAIAAGAMHSLVLQPGGKIFAWGSNSDGQTNTPARATNAIAIAAGGDHSLALRADHTVVAWGSNPYGVTNVPPHATNVVAIAAGDYHSLALRADHTVVGWGDNSAGQANGTAAGSNVVAIAGGSIHSLALKADGTVVGWGDNSYGQTNSPATATNVVAIAAGAYHSLALRADGTVVGWGYNSQGEANGAVAGSNVVAIAAAGNYSLALKADGSVVGWGTRFGGHASIPTGATDVRAISAGQEHNLALRADGSVVGWGANYSGEATIPASATNVIAIAAGIGYSLVAKADGSVIAWGYSSYGQTSPPASATNVVTLASGGHHSLALRADGTVVGWGYNSSGQATGVPTTTYPFLSSGVVTLAGKTLTNVVSIAAGGFHSLALRADGTVVSWGRNDYGQTNVPPHATNVVAIAAGFYHSLALRADGTVVSWGRNNYGQTNVPPHATNVVAIAAGDNHSLALRADGSVVGWGDNYHGQITIPAGATNVVAMAGGADHSLFLTVTETAGPAGHSEPSLVRAHIPDRVGELLVSGNRLVLTNLDLNLHDAAIELCGAKALLQAVLELGMPYTLERDDVLHGFLYGSEALADLNSARAFLEAENARLQASPDAKPQALPEVALLRYLCFSERLQARFDDLQAIGQPEIPRVVGHTLRLLNLLRDAWTQPANSPPPALEVWSESSSPRLLLYGEPYAHYTLQYRDSLGVPGWTTTTTTNWHNEDVLIPLVSGRQRFYRGMLPVP